MNEANRNRNDRRVPPNNDPPNYVNRYQPNAHQQRWNRRATSDTSRQSLHPQRPRLQPLIVASNTNNDNPTISRQLPLQPPMLTSDPDPYRPAIVAHPPKTWTAPRDHGSSTLGVVPQQLPQPQPQTSVGSTIQQQLPPSATTNLPQSPPTSQLRTYLTTLSESCRKHQLTAHTTLAATTAITQQEEEEGASPNHFCYPLSSAPTYCQDAIQTLIRILPHIEDCMQQTIQDQQQRQQQWTLHQVDRGTTASMVHPITTRNNNDINDNDDDMDNILLMISHMCDFYTDVMRGGFCPQAPHLFVHSVQGKFT
jgi:hypothetical protein